ncbi:LysM peptidoglycan-binding domain-containing protein [Thorsellia anophelis]|uniref:TIGR02594 family protein n=1 Tax=Thorsellia anophelis DSM 18579 TaxID=1123402 RepID=A0A1I0FT10_9GAMM|nr:TIGR02594 family protein [Thorsellia anophelis]SET60694.1 TIGR02594 family protein [Thorsellia anophelis DSM 18579]
MKDYAPFGHGNNNPVEYAARIRKAANLSETIKIEEIPDAQFEIMINTIESQEGYIAGEEGWIQTTTVTVTDGSRPIPNEPAQVKLGNKTYEMETDSFGRLPLIAHDEPGKQISISTKNATGEYQKVYQAEMAESSKLILLVKNFIQFSANARVHDPKITPLPDIRKPQKYVIQPKDTLSKIAKSFNVDMNDLAKKNNIADINKIYPGETLIIYGEKQPENKPEQYTVKKGDSLYKIAREKGTSIEKIAQDNNISDINRLDIGQILVISSSSAPAKAPVKTESKKQEDNNEDNNKEKSQANKKNESKGKDINLKSENNNPANTVPIDQKRAPWMEYAINEAKKWAGKDETIINETINYHKEVNVGLKTIVGDNNPWCASFVNYCFQCADYPISSPPSRASSFIDNSNFKKIDRPVYGCLIIWEKPSGSGHVGFIYGKDKVSNDMIILGGNQNDSINFRLKSSFKMPFKGYYAPDTYDISKEPDLSIMEIDELIRDFNMGNVQDSNNIRTR